MLERLAVVGPFQCNCRCLICPETGDACLIDPGDEPEKILRMVRDAETQLRKPVQLKWLFHTHGHLDHIAATRRIKEAFPGVPSIALHRGDEELYLKLQDQGKFFGFQFDTPLPVDHFFEDEEELAVGTLKFKILHTPGHSPGSVSLRLGEGVVFTGDTLFQGSVGRTDLWGASQDQMFKSIRQRLLTLDGDTRVCPGHGPDTRIGVEKKTNPFLV